MKCAACRLRTARCFGWFDPRRKTGAPRFVCSMRCMHEMRRRLGVIDPDEHEIAAIQAASPMAGEYLESIGKTDLAVLTDTEWLTLLEVIITAYQDALAQRLDSGSHPAPPLPGRAA